MPCAFCPEGCATVWVASESGGNLTWKRLVHVDSWNMVPNRQEANKKRTSDTGGAAVKFCSDITDWTFEVTNTLCIDDWLYADILSTATNPSFGKEAWFFFGWGCEHAPAPHGTGSSTPTTGDVPTVGTIAAMTADPFVTADSGVYAFGTVNPPGFGMDNTGSDPATGDWTLSVSQGPILPPDVGSAGVGPYSVSDSDPTNVESAA